MTVGQFCTNPGILVISDSNEGNQLIQSLKTELEKIAASTMLNQSIARNFHKGISEVVANKDVSIITNPNETGQQVRPVLASVKADTFFKNPKLHFEIFGPYSLIVQCKDFEEMKKLATIIEGQLTASIFSTPEESNQTGELTELLIEKAGRIIFNGVLTGVEVVASMTHGGPFPASTDSRFTAVGHYAIRRWLRPVTFQS